MRVLRRLLVVMAAGAVWWLATRWWRGLSDPPDVPAPATPWPPITVPAADPGPAWVAPVDGNCPDGFPVKVKVRSGLYHLPGMVAYARTGPDRCYATPEAAEADGFTRARR